MEKLISYCGIDCLACDAYKATQNNDQALREKTAAEWTKMYGFYFTPDMINCTSCTGNGVKVEHCSECNVRKCASEKSVVHSGACAEFKTCKDINDFFEQVPNDVKNRLLDNLI